jgi:undecaprenyl phosphate-alpha-L-ara4N flippase subunit ArnE
MEGITPLLIVIGAMMFLHERLDWRGWSGVALTCVGVVLVSMS